MTSTEKKTLLFLFCLLLLGTGVRFYAARRSKVQFKVLRSNLNLPGPGVGVSSSPSQEFFSAVKNSSLIAEPAAMKVGDYPKGLVDINRAGKEELESLPFIGKSTAKDIADYRTLHGPFKNKSDLLKVKKISISLYKKIEPYIRVR